MYEVIEIILTYVRGVWRHRWYALGLAWVICLAGWIVVLRLPDEYQATARVYVDTQSMLRPLLQGITIQSDPGSQLGLIARTLLSRPNLEKIARMTDLDLGARDNTAMDEVLKRLVENTQFLGTGRENLYTIGFSNPNPELAKKVVQALLTVFVENTLGETRQDTDTAQRFLERQINDYEARLVAAEQRLVEFKRHNVGTMPGNDGGYYGQLESAKTELETARLELQQAENRRESLKRQLAGQEPVKTDANSPIAPITLPIDARIERFQQQLDELLLRYTDKHPDIKILQRTLADLQQQREKELADYKDMLAKNPDPSKLPDANPIYQQLRINLSQEEAQVASLQVRVSNYENRVQTLQAKINTAPEVEGQLKALDRDYAVTRSNYDALLARREQARLSQQAEQTTDDIRFRVIDPPRVPPTPSGPNRSRLLSGVLGGGAAAGLGLAFVLAQLLSTFDSRRSLMQATNLPVFGSVGIILSATASRRRRFKLLIYLCLFALLLLLYAALMVADVTGNLPKLAGLGFKL
jgi:polysaccharide chain length determinant protein (PEP-CTERM system associated)